MPITSWRFGDGGEVCRYELIADVLVQVQWMMHKVWTHILDAYTSLQLLQCIGKLPGEEIWFLLHMNLFSALTGMRA